MILSVFVFIMCIVITAVLYACVINLSDIEKHDEAVRMRLAEARKSEPPEWADPERWWESEGRM